MTLPLFALTVPDRSAEWTSSHKGSRALLDLAGRHYTRQTPDSNQFCRPGKNLCLLLSDATAGWVVWRPLPEVGRMDGLECWECTFFRNEGLCLSSELIVAATDLTYREWGWPPPDGLITAVGVRETARRRSKRSLPGKCFLDAGWTPFDKDADEDLPVPVIQPPPDRVWLRAPRPQRTPLKETP